MLRNMTLEGWREAVAKCADDPVMAELTAKLLFEQDEAKNELHTAGFGVTGTPWKTVVEEVIEFTEIYR